MKKRNGLVSFLIGPLVAGCGTLQEITSNIPPNASTYEEVFVEDVSPPPTGDDPYAQKLYAYTDNLLEGSNPNNLLFKGDFNYAEFRCTRESPAEVLVGFSKRDFSRVTIGGYWISSLDVSGYIANPLLLAKMISTRRFVIDLEKGEEGFADPNPLNEWSAGGEIQIDTGSGGVYFKASFEPTENYGPSYESIIGIDYLKVGG